MSEPTVEYNGRTIIWVSACSAMADVVVDIDGDQLLMTVDQAHALADALLAAVFRHRDTVIDLNELPADQS